MNHNNKGKKSSEWVGAPACAQKANTSETFTPFDRGLHLSERELRLRERTKRIEEQAANMKLTSGKAIGSTMTSHQNEAKSHESLNTLTQPANIRRKMSSVSQPDSSHSVVSESISEQLPSSLEDGLRPEPICNNYRHTFTHQKRVSNSTNISRKMEIKINFPSPNDKIWNKVNAELEQIIPSIFPSHKINKLSTSDLSQQFDKWLHAFFVERFGTLPVTENKSQTQSRKTRTNNILIHLFLIFSVLTSLRICFPCDVQLPLKFKKVSEKREMGQKQVLTVSHMFRTRNARHSFILSYNLVVKSGEAKIFLLTGHKHT